MCSSREEDSSWLTHTLAGVLVVSHLSNISLRTSNHLWHIDNQSHGLGSPRRGSWIVWQRHLGLAFCKLAFLDVLDYMCTITLFLDLKHTACNGNTSFLHVKLFTPMEVTLVPGCGTIYMPDGQLQSPNGQDREAECQGSSSKHTSSLLLLRLPMSRNKAHPCSPSMPVSHTYLPCHALLFFYIENVPSYRAMCVA